jgi:predicted Rossmann fold nucleotide-binding protein DprA/Smf involved in DNA uptake
MADPLSIFGAAAATSQLVEQGAKVIKFACEIYSRFQNPEKTQQQLAQVKQVMRCMLSVLMI